MTIATDPLVERARAAALAAYAPYSRFSVGCAIESVDGEIAVGANMENACYRLGVCAEIAALTAAQQAFGLGKVARIAVAGGHVDGGALAGEGVCTPCGGCRQRLREFGSAATRVHLCDGNGVVQTVLLGELLPKAFDLSEAGSGAAEDRAGAGR